MKKLITNKSGKTFKLNLKSSRSKMVFFVVGLIVVVLFAYTFFVIQQNSITLHRQLLDKGMSINSSLSGVAANNALAEKFYTLQEGLIAVKNKNKDINYVYLMDKNGEIYAHSDPGKIGEVVNDEFTKKIASSDQSWYKRYTTEDDRVFYDISTPVSVDLEHWGNLRVGIYTDKIDKAIADARNLAIGMALILIVIGAFLSFLMARTLLKPLNYLSQKVNLIAQGDLSQNINLRRNDEFGALAKAMDEMVHNMRSLISEVLGGSQQVTATSEMLSQNAEEAAKVTQHVAGSIGDVAGGNIEQTEMANETLAVINQLGNSITQISQGAQEQARNINDTSGIISTMANSIEDVAARSKKVSEAATKTAEIAATGGEAVQSSIKGMSSIKDKVFETATRVKELGEYSSKIGEIIQVIDDIAEQTNLLALNAAIEAARAGEHGKGFAVVADEVRKLAERSSKATKEIADLINNIQSGTDRAVVAMEEGTSEVETGSKLSIDAGKALEDIVASVNFVNEDMQNIFSAVQELSSNSNRIVESINNVAAIAEENSASTEEIAANNTTVISSVEKFADIAQQNAKASEQVSAATEEMTATNEEIAASAKTLSELAEKLDSLVTKFKL